jgi:hypothetical protein
MAPAIVTPAWGWVVDVLPRSDAVAPVPAPLDDELPGVEVFGGPEAFDPGRASRAEGQGT